MKNIYQKRYVHRSVVLDIQLVEHCFAITISLFILSFALGCHIKIGLRISHNSLALLNRKAMRTQRSICLSTKQTKTKAIAQQPHELILLFIMFLSAVRRAAHLCDTFYLFARERELRAKRNIERCTLKRTQSVGKSG